MPIPSEVPTSFMPRTPVRVAAAHPSRLDFLGAFIFIAQGVFVISVVASIGLFLYTHSLQSQLASKQAQLQEVEKGLDKTAVQDFVSVHNQLSSAHVLLNQHLTLSRAFDLLEAMTVQNIKFTDLTLKMQPDDTTAKLQAHGIAADFNALASESELFKKDTAVSDTVFSGFLLKKNNHIGFSLDAVLSRPLVQNFAAVVAANATSSAAVSVATTTPGSYANATTTP